MLPIVFVHSGNRDYLPISLAKAQASNPRSDVILLGDIQNAHLGALARHVPMRPYAERAIRFAPAFRNLGPNRPDVTLLWLQRWMILHDYLRSNRIDQCLYIDSDVLLYGDVSADAVAFARAGMTRAGNSGHTNFISRIDSLAALCDLIEHTYQTAAGLAALEARFRAQLAVGWEDGISDMTFIEDLAVASPDDIIDISLPRNGHMYDESLTTTEGFTSREGIKQLSWQAGIPFVETDSGEHIEMRSLHFQGSSKRHMRSMLFLDSPLLDVAYHLNRPYVLAQRAWNRITRRRV